jgi:YceI-like protein
MASSFDKDRDAYTVAITVLRGNSEMLMRTRKHLLIITVVAFVPLAVGQTRPIDSSSRLVVHAFKSGLFSGFADNHEIEAPISEGTVDERGLRVSFVVDAGRMKVLDPKLSADKRREVQDRMEGPEVLDSARFPKIIFESTKVERADAGSMHVDGRLSLHGVTRPISLSVKTENGRFVGTCTLSQREFGIEPISIAGGTVKVKDELKIEFDIKTD